MENNKNVILKYPCVFVHGMFGWGNNEGINRVIPYWGATTGSLKNHLYSMGIEAYEASVGPISSVWDQACELYAQLAGTTVDYGAAHSARAGHSRYGRKYFAPLFANWSSKKKVHLIGHSFGGLCVRMLTHLLTYGAPEEVEATGDDTSPLFLGGHGDLIQSVTTICTPLNGTTAHVGLEFLNMIKPLKYFIYGYAGVAGRSFLNSNFVDFHLEQFDLTYKPGGHTAGDLKKSIQFMTATKDSVEYDLSFEGSKIFNKRIKISPDIYYFSYAYNCISTVGKNRHHLPLKCDFWFLRLTSLLLILESKHEKDVDYANDGLVNVNSALYPYKEPHKKYNYSRAKELKPGIWNVMPLLDGDHGTPIGLFASKTETHAFYARLIANLRRIENN